MRKRVHLFRTENDYSTERIGNYNEPWLSLTRYDQTKRLNYNKEESEKLAEKPLTFVVTGSGDICWKTSNSAFVTSIEYNKNDTEWTPITASTDGVKIAVASGDEVAFRGVNSSYHSNERKNFFSGTTCEFELAGNIMSLINKNTFQTLKTLSSSANFRYFFQDCTGLTDASKMVLPATGATSRCYQSMFQGCTGLVEIPRLPSNFVLASECLGYMYYGCSSLKDVPADYLPFETLATGCYGGMFQGCSSLETAPELNATGTIPEMAYYRMFYGCSSLADFQETLPATSVGIKGYNQMFYYCTSLTKAPNILATQVASNAFNGMFDSCTNLVTGPAELSVSAVSQAAFTNMFWGCSNLEKAPKMTIKQTVGDACMQMFKGCSNLNDVSEVELISETLAGNAYYEMFNGCAISATPIVSATTAGSASMYGMFKNCANLSNISNLHLPETLAYRCFMQMFASCQSLTTAPALNATTLADACYTEMFYNCTGLTKSPDLPALTLTAGCYKAMFNMCRNLNEIHCLATDISATECVASWVNSVSSTGTFYTDNASIWSRGTSGIPTNWNVSRESEIY